VKQSSHVALDIFLGSLYIHVVCVILYRYNCSLLCVHHCSIHLYVNVRIAFVHQSRLNHHQYTVEQTLRSIMESNADLYRKKTVKHKL